jgi:DNA-directed RNA polymerase subunit RPC12/RpoP
MLCQNKKYHNDNGGYLVTPNAFKQNSRCPYCIHNSGRVHCKDSFGSLYPEKAKYWSPNNKKSPYEVATYSNKKYKFICEKCGNEFEKILNDLNQKDIGVVCKDCKGSQLEQSTKKVLDKYNIKYKREYSYDDLFGIGKQPLRFDFYLLDYNLLIECQGQQHVKRAKGWQTEESFKRQQIYDKRKKDYCKKNNIKLLEIWYYEIDNIEDILINELNL